MQVELGLAVSTILTSAFRLALWAVFFRRLRDKDALGGRCGRCEFRTVCGGSRSRAFAATGYAFAEDPLCIYEPPVPASVAPAAMAAHV